MWSILIVYLLGLLAVLLEKGKAKAA